MAFASGVLEGREDISWFEMLSLPVYQQNIVGL